MCCAPAASTASVSPAWRRSEPCPWSSSAQVHRSKPARLGKGRRGPCRQSSQPPVLRGHRREATRLLAPFTHRRSRHRRLRAPRGTRKLARRRLRLLLSRRLHIIRGKARRCWRRPREQRQLAVTFGARFRSRRRCQASLSGRQRRTSQSALSSISAETRSTATRTMISSVPRFSAAAETH